MNMTRLRSVTHKDKKGKITFLDEPKKEPIEGTVLVAIPVSFVRTLEEAINKYESKKCIYGESWKTMSIDELRTRFVDEYGEWIEGNADDLFTERKELIDIINIALMLATRLDGIEPKPNELEMTEL